MERVLADAAGAGCSSHRVEYGSCPGSPPKPNPPPFFATDILGRRLGEGWLRGVWVLEHAVPAAFCVPGWRNGARIVVSRGTLELLTRDQLAAPIEHERGHLRQHHSSIISLADVVGTAVACGALRSYPSQVRRLAEMAADDYAARRCGSRVVASALLEMCAVGEPGSSSSAPEALAMTGSTGAERITRLLAQRPEHARRRFRGLLVGGLAGLLPGVPLLVLLAPAVMVAGSAHR